MAQPQATRRARRVSRMAVLVLAAGWLLAGVAHAAEPPSGRVPKPVIEAARGGQCVEDPATMRRDHMNFLKHQRDETVHGGVRGAKHSLKACIECHASQATHSVAATQTNFCVSCHSFAAVKIDCFECHATQPAATAAFHPLVHPTGTTAQLTRLVRALGAETSSARPQP